MSDTTDEFNATADFICGLDMSLENCRDTTLTLVCSFVSQDPNSIC